MVNAGLPRPTIRRVCPYSVCLKCKLPEKQRLCSVCACSLKGTYKSKFCNDCAIAVEQERVSNSRAVKWSSSGSCLVCKKSLSGTLRFKFCEACATNRVKARERDSNKLVRFERRHPCPKCGRDCWGLYCRLCRNLWL